MIIVSTAKSWNFLGNIRGRLSLATISKSRAERRDERRVPWTEGTTDDDSLSSWPQPPISSFPAMATTPGMSDVGFL